MQSVKKNTRQQWQHTYMHTSLFAQEVQHDIQRDMTQCEPDSKALDKKHPQLPARKRKTKQNTKPIHMTTKITHIHLSNGFSGIKPEKEVRRDDDDLSPIVLLEDFSQECPHLVEGPKRSS